MDAPLERIHGAMTDAVAGEIHLDPTDLAKRQAVKRWYNERRTSLLIGR